MRLISLVIYWEAAMNNGSISNALTGGGAAAAGAREKPYRPVVMSTRDNRSFVKLTNLLETSDRRRT